MRHNTDDAKKLSAVSIPEMHSSGNVSGRRFDGPGKKIQIQKVQSQKEQDRTHGKFIAFLASFASHYFFFLHSGQINKYLILGESHGLVVKAEDSQLSSCGFKRRRCILDGVREASYYKWKNEIKVAKWGTPKKKIKKKYLI